MQYIDGIPVWGNSEDNTLEQAKMCAKVADYVALMADNHLGYGVPIGGVIAAENRISPTAVGFDIACFIGDQKVETVDGRQLSFLEMIKESHEGIEHFGIALDDHFNPVIAKLECPRQTGMVKDLVAVELDNGEVITCTPEHIFYTRMGLEVTAGELQPQDSLMPLYLKIYGDVPLQDRSYRDKRMKLEDYTGVYNPSTNQWNLVHHLADAYNLSHGLDAHEAGPIRHHVNFNKLDNSPNNIKRMGWKEHFKLHSDVARERALAGAIGFGRAHKLHPEFFSKMGSDNMHRLHRRVDFAERRDARAPANLVAYNQSPEGKARAKGLGKRNGHFLANFNQSERGRIQSAESRQKPASCSKCGGMFANHSQVMKHYHADHKGVLNHKVVSVTRIHLDEEVPVFCLSVPDHANFALAAGVFVHNCGNKAVRLDVEAQYVRDNIEKIMDDVFSILSFGVGRKNNERVDNVLFEKDGHAGWDTDAAKPLKRKAEEQLGTIGSGNHYVDIFVDELDRVWIGVHFGSRGLGHGIATWFLKACGAQDGMMVEPVFLDVDSDLGAQYVTAMQLGGAYAYAGRDWVCERVAKILGGSIVEEIHNHHNFAWLEEHGGKKMWVCRKGATPAFPGQRGFVGGTMGETSVILEGVDSEDAKVALYSTVHGAGRVMGRMQAKGKTNKAGVVTREGLVKPEMMKEWMTKSKVTLRGGGVDESPHCYKRLDEVLAFHSSSIKVQHVLTPLGVAMAGEREFDPYKD